MIGKAPRGTELVVTREVGDWVKVSWPAAADGAGYVRVTALARAGGQATAASTAPATAKAAPAPASAKPAAAAEARGNRKSLTGRVESRGSGDTGTGRFESSGDADANAGSGRDQHTGADETDGANTGRHRVRGPDAHLRRRRSGRRFDDGLWRQRAQVVERPAGFPVGSVALLVRQPGHAEPGVVHRHRAGPALRDERPRDRHLWLRPYVGLAATPRALVADGLDLHGRDRVGQHLRRARLPWRRDGVLERCRSSR